MGTVAITGDGSGTARSSWRDDPTFAQRHEARLVTDAFTGRCRVAETPGDWQDDLAVRCRRRGEQVHP